jgi:hypothetical protein
MGSLANLFNLNLTTDLPSIYKTKGGYLCKLSIDAHSGPRTVTQTFTNVLTNGTPYILVIINNTGWQGTQYRSNQGTYAIDVWVGNVHYTTGWWVMEWTIDVIGKNITATIDTTDSSSAVSSIAKYSFPATSMEVAFIEMSEPV